jgi:hypothetical protein
MPLFEPSGHKPEGFFFSLDQVLPWPFHFVNRIFRQVDAAAEWGNGNQPGGKGRKPATMIAVPIRVHGPLHPENKSPSKNESMQRLVNVHRSHLPACPADAASAVTFRRVT